jgi:hypothetical protein
VGPDGSVYVADTGAGCVRRVAPNGIISTFAGICEADAPPPPLPVRSSPDKDFPGGAAPVLLTRPADVAVAPDGGVYIADRGERLIHYVAPDGTVAMVAGGGGATGSDGDRAVEVLLGSPTGIALGPNGDLFVAEQSAGLVRRVGVDGRIFTVAGTGFDGDLGDGGPAVEAQLINPWKVTPARHYLHDRFRYPAGWRDLGPRLNPALRQLDRVPRAVAGAGAGAAYGGASAAFNNKQCGCS